MIPKRHVVRQSMKSHLHYLPSLLVGLIVCLTVGFDVRAGDFTETTGEILQYVLPATAAGIAFIHKDGKGAWQLGGSAAMTMGVTYGLKYSVDETRPNGDSRSFPSAHTSISFSAAEFMRKRYGWKFGVPAYAAAAFVAYSRVESREHYTHDVLAGAVIGIVSSYLLTTPFQGWQVHSDIDGWYWGIRISGHW
jgi:membrane-associated phospholipid phosphatase